MVDLTVLKLKLEIIIRSVVDASGGPPYFRVNCGPKGRKFVFFGDLPPYLRVWMTDPHPFLKVWIRQ